MARNRRAFDQACAYLTDRFDKGDFGLEGRLPSLATLAVAAGVSDFTMWHAVNALCGQGRITSNRRRRATLSRTRASHTAGIAAPVRRSKSSALQKRIRQDVHNGLFHFGRPLPSGKELADRYGVYRATLRKALDALVEDRFLQQRGSSLFPLPIFGSGVRPRSRIVLLGSGGSIGTTITFGYWHQECLRIIETECAKANLSLDIVCFYRDAADNLRLVNGRTELPVTLEDTTDVVGYLYESTGADSFDEELLEMLARTGKPIALYDETGEWPPLSLLRRHPGIRVFRNSISHYSARLVARFMLGLGHRRVAFISPVHSTGYSQHRLCGLEQEFSASGDGRIVAITSSTSGDTIAQGVARFGLDRLRSIYAEQQKLSPYGYGYALGVQVHRLAEACGDGRVFEDLELLLDKAILLSDVTAWIMVSDLCAHYAFDYLTRKGIPVPDHTSIIGFDDHPIALQTGMTSFNFNHSATMIDMLRYVADPRLYPARRPLVDIEGRIIPRQTTGRPRREALHLTDALADRSA